MLLEQGKDVLVLPPLTRDYDEFNAIQLQCNMMDRRLALLNPFRYFSSVQELKRLISTGATGRISSLEISIDPVYNIPFLAPVEGITGPALLLITMINEILASFPLSVMASLSATPSGISDMQLKSLAFDYQNMILNCHFIPGMSGWTLKATCEKDTLELRDSGELHSGNEGLMIKADRQVMLNGLRTGIEDFIQSVRERTEPESNSVEGLMQITINHAIERAITQGVKTDFVDRPYYVEADKVWMKENRI
jgi:predicted dehydrogenase